MFPILSYFSARQLRPALVSIRNLNVHEYISMGLLKEYGVPVPKYHVANSADEASDIFENFLNQRELTYRIIED